MKRFISFILISILMVLNLDHISLNAASVSDNEAESYVSSVSDDIPMDHYEAIQPEVWVNPGYEDIFSVSDIKDSFDEDGLKSISKEDSLYGTAILNENEAAAFVAKALKERTKKISFNSDCGLSAKKIIQKAYEYSDADPDGGDYLRANIIGFTASVLDTQYQILPVYAADAEQEKAVDEKVKQIITQLDLKNEDTPEYIKVRDIHDHLIDLITYAEYSDDHNDGKKDLKEEYLYHSTYAALINNRCVCQGYCSAFYRLCKEAGINSKYIIGSKMNHTWNIVRLYSDDEEKYVYYNVDVTWDDKQDGPDYTWFLKNEADFSGHVGDDEFLTADFKTKYPMAAESFKDVNNVLVDVENTEYLYNSVDGKIVSTKADNKPKLIFYSDLNDENTVNLLKGLSGEPAVRRGTVDVVFVDTAKASKETVEEFAGKTDIYNNISFCYETTSKAYDVAGGYIEKKKLIYPVGVLVDEKDHVRYITMGRLLASDIVKRYLTVLRSDWDPNREVKAIEIRKYQSVDDDQYSVISDNGKINVSPGQTFVLKGIGVAKKADKEAYDAAVTIDIAGDRLASYDEKTGIVTVTEDFDSLLNSEGVIDETVKITFTSVYDDRVKKSIELTASPVDVTAIKFDKAKYEVIKGSDIKLSVIYSPSDATVNRKLTWSSSNESIVKVSENGTVSGISAGTATIYVTTANNKKTSCKVEVKNAVKAIEFHRYADRDNAGADKYESILKQNSTIALQYANKTYLKGFALPYNETIADFDADTKAVVKNEDIVSYDATTGEIFAKKTGKTSIVFTSVYDEDIKATIYVNVTDAYVTGIYFDDTNISMSRNEERNISLKHRPEVTSESMDNVIWKSSDKSIIDVYANGEDCTIRSFDKEGTATITAQFKTFTATMRVSVSAVLKLDKTSMTLVAGRDKTASLDVKIASSKYTEDDLVWTSSDENIIKVNKGELTVIDDIEASTAVTVTVSTLDGAYSDTCIVTVNPKPSVSDPYALTKQGCVNKGTRIALNSATFDAQVYYTLTYDTDKIKYPGFNEDGSPQDGTYLYSDAIVIDKDMTICAVAVKEGYKNSKIVTFAYEIDKDWGDIDDELKAVFENDTKKIPEGIWYVICGRIYSKDDVKDSFIVSTDITKTYTSAKIEFNDEIRVFHGSMRLYENRDYSVSYKNNVNVTGSADPKKAAAVIVKGKGNYGDSAQFSFTVGPKDINGAVLISEPTVFIKENTKLNSVKPKLTFEGKNLSLNKDYSLSYIINGVQTDGDYGVSRNINDIEAVISGKNNFTGEYKTHISVNAIDPYDASAVLMNKVKVTQVKVPYRSEGYSLKEVFEGTENGQASVKVTYNNNDLKYDEDFTAVLTDGSDGKITEVGKHSIVLRGIAKPEGTNFVGDKVITVEIGGIEANKVKVAGLNGTASYTGKKITLQDLFNSKDKFIASFGLTEVTLYTLIDEKTVFLDPDKDYDVKINDHGLTGKTEVVFELKGKYRGKIKKNINVKPYDIGKDPLRSIQINTDDAVFTKEGATPGVSVSFNGIRLREGIDYSLSYKNNTKASLKTDQKAPAVTIKGKGHFTGTALDTFNISKADIRDCVEPVAPDKIYNEKAKKDYFKSVPKLMDGTKAVSVGKDIEKFDAKKAYRYYFADTKEEIPSDTIVKAGTLIEVVAIVTCGPDSSYKEGTYELKGYYKILNKNHDLKTATVKINDPKRLSFDNGENVIPLKEKDLTVTLNKRVLRPDDYEIVSVKNNRFIGTATVKLRAKGEYGGTKSFTFKINAKSLKNIYR